MGAISTVTAIIFALCIVCSAAVRGQSRTVEKQQSDTTEMPANTRSLLFSPLKSPISSVTTPNVSDSVSTVVRIEDYTGRPDKSPFSPFQDTMYYRLKRLYIPPSTLALHHFRLFSYDWGLAQTEQRPSPWRIVENNLKIPENYFVPSGREQVQRQYAISQSQERFSGFPQQTPGSGLQIPFSAIGEFFGLSEDFDPTLQYTVEYTATVEAVVYSTQAKIVATLFKQTQAQGQYRVSWNGRDGKGKKMPPGDYVIEIRIGQERLVRKRTILQ